MERIVVRHHTGSKANQVEEFPLNHFSEIVLGRDPSATVKYDPDRDDLVGRQHAKIAPDPNNPGHFTVTDLNSRNGTYVNKQRIAGTTRIAPGDLIQLGPGGPEFQFDLEPRPMNTVKSTRSPDAPGANVPPTRQIDLGTPATRSVSLSPASSTSPTGTVGKATVERMISQNIAITKRTESRKYMMIGGVVLAVLILGFGAVAGYLYFRGSSSETQIAKVLAGAPMDSAAIDKANRNAIVKVEVAWRLLSPAGAPVYHRYMTNAREDKKGNKGLLVANAGKSIACYVQLKDGTIEPYLTYDNSEFSIAIGGQHSGTGFVVNDEGYILTSRNVAAAWMTPYDFPEGADAGILYADDKKTPLREIKEEEVPRNWIPAQSRQEMDIKQGSFDGKNDRLEVAFPGKEARYVAQLSSAAPRYDVAMLKVSFPSGSAPKVQMEDRYDSTRPGDGVVMMGYPTDAPPVFGIGKTKGLGVRTAQDKEIVDPVASTGNIGKILREREASGNRPGIVSSIGDAYQLTINSDNAGNSGAPVFDNHGKVIAIFSCGRKTDTTNKFAVPIRYAIELMSVGSPAK